MPQVSAATKDKLTGAEAGADLGTATDKPGEGTELLAVAGGIHALGIGG